MANYIYYKGKKYGDGTDQKIKAVSMDWFLENNFQTQEEIDEFIEQYNNGGFVISQDSSGYVLVPSTDELIIHSAIMTDDAANGLIYNEWPEELDILLDNGVQGYFTGMKKAVVVQGLRCINGYKTSFRGPKYTSGSWSIQDSAAFTGMLSPSGGQNTMGLTYQQILDMYRQAGESCPCSLVENIQYFIDSGEIEKFIYSDILTYVHSGSGVSRACDIYYNTLTFQGIDSSERFLYNVFCFDQRTGVYDKGEFNGTGLSAAAFRTNVQPDIFGYIPCVQTIGFSEDKNIFRIPKEYTRKTKIVDGQTYYQFEDSLGNYYEETSSSSSLYHVRTYFDSSDETKNGLYQKVTLTTEEEPCLWKYITEAKNFPNNSSQAIASIFFVPIALNKDANGKYTQVVMQGNTTTSATAHPHYNALQTLEECAYNQSLTERTEPKNWLELKKNMGVP